MKRIVQYFCSSGRAGMKAHGRCDQEGIELISTVWSDQRHKIDSAISSTHWMNVYMQKKFFVEETQELKRLHEWTEKLVKRCAGPKYFLHHVGFFFTPKHSTHEQEFHVDFNREV